MSALPWIGFVAMVLGFLAMDLGVFNRRAHSIGLRESLGWTAVWVAAALLFCCLVYLMYEHHWLGMGLGAGQEPDGRRAAIKFLTGYVVEKSLSLDNIFVIALIFAYFRVPAAHQHRVLFWGIVGALILRGLMIGAGAALIRRFAWSTYVLGGFLLLTAVKMLRSGHGEVDPDRNLLVRAARRIFPITPALAGQRFFVRAGGRLAATPLLLVLLLVESSDIVFAVDSIPAIFAITYDPFIVFTSNIFAVLGLRSLYFALAGVLDRFRYLKQSLVVVLAYVGSKMLLAGVVHVPALLSLAVICAVLGAGVAASTIVARRTPAAGKE